MKVELHLHTTAYSACAVAGPQEMMKGLVQRGYGAVYITEHDAVWSRKDLRDLQRLNPKIKIFGGMELGLDFGGKSVHLLVLGTTDKEYLQLRDRPQDILTKAREENHLTVLAHPYRYEGADAILHAGMRPDAIEYRTNNQTAEQGLRSQSAAAQHGMALVNAGDTHGIDRLDRFWIQTTHDLAKADDIRRVILAGEYRNCMSSELERT